MIFKKKNKINIEERFNYPNHFYDNDHVISKLVIGRDDVNKNPLVSVVMPVYNHPDFFRKSLLSVINQKCDFEFEIIVVDNGHPEFQLNNQIVVEQLYCDKIRYYVNEQNLGGVGNENRGVKLAKGKYITFCHDDDMLYEDTLSTLINYSRLVNDKKKAIFGRFVSIDENDNVTTTFSEWDSVFLKKKKGYNVRMCDFLVQNYTNGCGSLYLRSCYIEIGGFCVDYIPIPDYALNAYYTSMYGAFAIGDKTLKYRVSSQSDTSMVYKKIIEKNRKLRRIILDNYKKPWFLPNYFVNLNLKMGEMNLYSKWDENKPPILKLYFYKIINRLFIYLIYINRSLR